MNNFFAELVRKFIKAITPPPIGGLFINDWSIQYLELKDTPKVIPQFDLSAEESRSGFLRLPPGIVESGKIKDKQNFVAALKEVHHQITPDTSKIINVVLSIPASGVYVQSFNLPRLAEKGLSQAAELNSKMISPIPIEGAYYGWQRIGENVVDGGQIELLGAFVIRSLVDEFTSSLREAGFGVAVVEFSSLSVTRNLNALGILSKDFPYLVIEFNSGGLDFMILRNNNLYFDYSYSWRGVLGEERNISLDGLSRVLKEEIQRLFNFYSSRWGGQVKNFIVIAPSLGDEFVQIIKEAFRESQAQVLPATTVNPVLGAALRGLTPRVKDSDITLTSVSVAEMFLQDQLVNFVSIWRNILISTFGFVLLIFAASELFIIKVAGDLDRTAVINLKSSELTELTKLKAEVVEFNKGVSFLKSVKDMDRNLSPILKLLADLGGSRIRLDRISLPAVGQSGLITGETDSEESAIDFKNKVSKIPQFSNLDLPLASLITKADGRVSFTLNFKIQSLNF